jgi:hypothetical protein
MGKTVPPVAPVGLGWPSGGMVRLSGRMCSRGSPAIQAGQGYSGTDPITQAARTWRVLDRQVLTILNDRNSAPAYFSRGPIRRARRVPCPCIPAGERWHDRHRAPTLQRRGLRVGDTVETKNDTVFGS